jgi:hypothetical protein
LKKEKQSKVIVTLFYDVFFFLGIILAFAKRSPIEIAEAIRNFSLELTSIELVQHLIQYLPNDSEVGRLRKTNESMFHFIENIKNESSIIKNKAGFVRGRHIELYID